MTDYAATKGIFADFKIVKTRKVAQLIVEIPLEQADAALEALGGLPTDETWVAVARLEPEEKREPEKPKRQWGELSSAEQAGIRCAEPDFDDWLYDHILWAHTERPWPGAAPAVRDVCGVQSRSELNTNPEAAAKWRELDQQFMARHMTEER